MSSIIYKLTHLPSGKFYIGSLKDSSRFSKYNSSSEDVAKLIKLNPEEWKKEILQEFTDLTFTEVVCIEQKLIEKYVTEFGWEAVWNKSFLSGHGRQFSEEANEKRKKTLRSEEKRKQISESMKKYAAKNPNPMQGKKHSITAREKLRLSHLGKPSPKKGKPVSEETKHKLREANLGKKLAEETKEKISNALKGNPNLTYWKGKKVPEEILIKRSASLKKAWERRKCQ